MESDRLGDLSADPHHRVECLGGVLEDDADLSAADSSQSAVAETDQFAPVEHDRAGHDGFVWLKSDGSIPSREELSAAASECKAVAGEGGGGESGRFATNAWAAKALECMKERGFERVEIALPAPAEADE